MSTGTEKRETSYWVHTAIYFLFTFCGGFFSFGGISPLGMSILGIFIGMIWGWTFIGFIWPSMMSIFALGLCGFFKTPQAAFANAFSNHLVIFMLLVLVFTAYCEKSGINAKISAWFLSRKSLAGRPWTFTYMVFLGSFVASFLVDGNAMVFLVWNLLYSVFEETGYKEGERYPAFLCAGVAIAAVLSYACKPWGNVCILAIGALETSTGGACTLNYLTFMAVSIPLCILFLTAYFLVVKYIFRPDVAKLRNLSPEYLAQMRSSLKLNTREKIAAASLVVFMALLLIPNIFMGNAAFLGILGSFNFLSAVAVVLIALCVMRLEQKPVLDFQSCAARGIHWNVFWITAAAIPVSAALSSDVAGITTWLSGAMEASLTGMNVFALLIAFAIILNVATQFTHNVSLVVIAVPIGVPMCNLLGLNPVAMTVMIIVSAGCAYATPAASTCAAILFSNVEWIGVKNSFKAGVSASVAGLLTFFVIGFPIIAMVYGFTK